MSKYDFKLYLDIRNSNSLIIDKITPKSTIFEFGPAHGRMSKYLNEELDCKIYAVEIDPDGANEAKKYCEKIMVGDIEAYHWLQEYKDVRFDYIIFADVLEHLYDPWRVLEEARILLKDDGSILVSIPNIAHNSIIMELIYGDFNYQKIGLLDNTHIRFFTKNTIEQMFTDSGYSIVYETGVYFNPELTEFNRPYSSLNEILAHQLRKREYGEVYQYIIEAKKSNYVEEKKIVKREEYLNTRTIILYYDLGRGFYDEDSKKKIVDKNDMVCSFELSDLENIQSIRFDPCDYPAKVKLKSFKIDGVDKISCIKSNSNSIQTDNEHLFLHNDPQFICDLDNSIKHNNVTITFDSIIPIDNLFEEVIKSKEIIIESLEQEKEAILQSWSFLIGWRITRFLRLVARPVLIPFRKIRK